MSARFGLRFPLENSRVRAGLFAIELLDAATLERVSSGIEVIAEGLPVRPVVNASGLFVWLQGDLGALRKVSVRPGAAPYESVEIAVDQLRLPPARPAVTTIELPPRGDYVFATGITGLRGRLVEDTSGSAPVRNAVVCLSWLDDDGVTWRDAPTTSHTNRDGDFVTILRLTASDTPSVDTENALTVRLRVNERTSAELKLIQGRVAEPTATNPFVFVWSELTP